MLHSFWYEKAAEAFAVVAEKDPACSMAYWGIAMTYYPCISTVLSSQKADDVARSGYGGTSETQVMRAGSRVNRA